jgi:hypothetical protein
MTEKKMVTTRLCHLCPILKHNITLPSTRFSGAESSKRIIVTQYAVSVLSSYEDGVMILALLKEAVVFHTFEFLLVR